jgi:hypothetical protein
MNDLAQPTENNAYQQPRAVPKFIDANSLNVEVPRDKIAGTLLTSIVNSAD